MTLRCTIEIVPFGDEEEKYPLYQFEIFNKGNAEFGHCKYGVIELDLEKNIGSMYDEDILHRRHLGAAALVEKVLAKKRELENE